MCLCTFSHRKNEFLDPTDPTKYGLPSDYIFASESETKFGHVFYKKPANLYVTWAEAKAYCEADGAQLPVPRSEQENRFFANVRPYYDQWLGINDIENEGEFVDPEGNPITYTLWRTGEKGGPTQPDNGGRNGDEDVVAIWAGRHAHWPKWFDRRTDEKAFVTCAFYPPPIDLGGKLNFSSKARVPTRLTLVKHSKI